jgi:hypothetical protein
VLKWGLERTRLHSASCIIRNNGDILLGSIAERLLALRGDILFSFLNVVGPALCQLGDAGSDTEEGRTQCQTS